MPDPRPLPERPMDGAADLGSLVAMGVEEPPPVPEPIAPPPPVEPG